MLLSPACASYDQYRNFEVRGEHFRQLVTALPGIVLRTTVSNREADMSFSRADRSSSGAGGSRSTTRCCSRILVLIGVGLVLSLAASPAVALKKGLPAFYFVERHVLFAALGVLVMLAVSLLDAAPVRRLALVAARGRARGHGVRAGHGPRDQRRAALAAHRRHSLQPSEFAKPAFVVLSAWLFAEASGAPTCRRCRSPLPSTWRSPRCW